MEDDAIVTGGAVFIVSATYEMLTKEGFKAVIVDNLYSGSLSNVSELINAGKDGFVKAASLN